MIGFRLFILIVLASIQGRELLGQSGCQPRLGSLYGVEGIDERGKSIVYLPEEDLVLVFGTKGDSVSVLYLESSGVLRKVVNFVIMPGGAHHLAAACLDPDGMVGLAGHFGSYALGGQVFACRFDPGSATVVWARAFTSFAERYTAFTIAVNPASGHYVMANNPLIPNVNNDLELVELDRTTGKILTGLTGYYDLGVNDAVAKLLFHEGYLYGIGRFSYSAAPTDMRNSVIKLATADGRVEWLRMGHVGRVGDARLYGVDLHIRNDEMFALYHGDPAGPSTTNTQLFVQRSGENGQVRWVKRYDLPGQTDTGIEMIPVDEDYVILASDRQSGRFLYLLRIDQDGNLLWARWYGFDILATSVEVDRGTSRLVRIQDALWVTGTFISPAGDAGMIILRTNLDGLLPTTCTNYISFSLPVTTIPDPVFEVETPNHYVYALDTLNLSAAVITGRPDIYENCTFFEPVRDTMAVQLCAGQTYSGYGETGFYSDTFALTARCDSIRDLHITVLPVISSQVDTTGCPGQSIEGYTDPGVFIDTLTGSNGCDSIRTLSITHALPRERREVSLCEGETYFGLPAPGVFLDTIAASGTGCDTVFEYTLLAVPSSESWTERTICLGEEFEGHAIEGIYTDTLVSHSGCDSIRHLNLQVLEPLLEKVSSSVCDPESSHREPGVYVDSLLSHLGCDSIVTREITGLDIYLPNIFSPNQDGVNDVIILDPGANRRPEGVRFAVFDRWGDMVYETHQWPVQWDGRSRGGGVPGPGVYTFMLAYDCGGDRHVEHGTFTLLR